MGPSFPGNRYAPPEVEKELLIIFDTNGFIGGMHSVVPKEYTSSQYDFAASQWYRQDQVLGSEVYLTTAYFVDPALICGSGRTQADFEAQGKP